MISILVFDIMLPIRALAFWYTHVDRLTDFESEMMNFSFRVPGNVFKRFVKVLFYFFIPYGLIATIPTQFFTGIIEGQYWVLTLLVCFILSLMCRFIWKLGLKHYGSASS